MNKLITQDNVVNEQWVQYLNSDRLNLSHIFPTSV